MKDFTKEIQDVEQELSRLNTTYDSLLRKLNVSEGQLDELAQQVKSEKLPVELQKELQKAQDEAKRAGEERATRTAQSIKAVKSSLRKGIVRI